MDRRLTFLSPRVTMSPRQTKLQSDSKVYKGTNIEADGFVLSITLCNQRLLYKDTLTQKTFVLPVKQ